MFDMYKYQTFISPPAVLLGVNTVFYDSTMKLSIYINYILTEDNKL